MEQTSVFTEYLQELADYSARTDTAKITDADYVRLQRMVPRIVSSYQNKYLNTWEYRALNCVYACVKDTAQDYMQAKQTADRISKQVTT